MSKDILIALGIFGGGVAVGVGATLLIQRIISGKKKEKVEPLLMQDIPEKKEEKKEAHKEKEPVEEVVIEVTQEEYDRWQEYLRTNGYTDEPEENDISEEEQIERSRAVDEYIQRSQKENEGKIVPIGEDIFYNDQDDYTSSFRREELYLFPNEYLLTNEDNALLEPISSYCGKIANRYTIETIPRMVLNDNSDEDIDDRFVNIYILNYPMEMKFKVRIPFGSYHDSDTDMDVIELIGRDDFFNVE